jgi:hypothetical protein
MIVCMSVQRKRGRVVLVDRGFREVSCKLHHLLVDFLKGGIEKLSISDEQKRVPCQSYCSPKY